MQNPRAKELMEQLLIAQGFVALGTGSPARPIAAAIRIATEMQEDPDESAANQRALEEHEADRSLPVGRTDGLAPVIYLAGDRLIIYGRDESRLAVSLRFPAELLAGIRMLRCSTAEELETLVGQIAELRSQSARQEELECACGLRFEDAETLRFHRAECSGTIEDGDLETILPERLRRAYRLLRNWATHLERERESAQREVAELVQNGLPADREEHQRTLEKNRLLKKALRRAVSVLKSWHDLRVPALMRNQAWETYYRHSPELGPVREALGEAPNVYEQAKVSSRKNSGEGPILSAVDSSDD